MSNDKNHDKFFNLLLENDDKKLENFLLDNGKEPKPVCPISFIKKEENKNE